MTTFTLPTTINDRYRIDLEIGRGGMGAVYRGFDLLLQREVAIKVLHGAGLGSSGRARLLNEAQAAARLSHPNLVAVYDAGEASGWPLPGDAPPTAADRLPFIVMQYVEGRPLNELGPQTPDRVVDLARQLCAALAHAHAAGVVHRDLKPENVLVSPDGLARLMDFGLARSGSTRLSVEGEIVGTVFYMPPELALGRPYDGRSDLYSLGVMLYELLAGRLPFQAGDPVAVISQHIFAPVVPPSTYNPAIPPTLEALVLRLMSKEPDGRLESAEAVAAWLALPDILTLPAALAPTSPAISPLERIARGRMIGRLAELQTVQTLWRQAAAGTGQVLLVSGEPGIGKTRLMRELAAMAEVSRGRALVGVCYAEGGEPYAPVVEIVRRLLSWIDPAALPPAVVAGLQPLAPELERQGRPLPTLAAELPAGSTAFDPHSEQAGLFDSLIALFSSLSRQAPLLIVLEDAHWADSGTLALVRRLARQVSGLPLLLALTYREVELGDSKALADLLYDLSRARLSTRLKLTRLSRDETAALLNVMFGEDVDGGAAGLRSEFLDLIYQETEGNPFFIEEVCKALIDEGQITYTAGKWQAAALGEIRVPQSVRLAIQARVGRLAQEAQDLLRMAAVFGREFEYEPLLAVSGLDEDVLIDCLDAAMEAQLIVEFNPRPGRTRHGSQMPLTLRLARPTFAFTHALIPAALLDDLSVMRRQRLHRLAGLALERLYPDRLEPLAAPLSRHFSEAGEHKKAVKYLVIVGDRARQVFAFSEAIAAYRQVADYLLDVEHYEKAARVLMKLGLVYHQAYDFVHAQEAYDQSFALWQRAAEAAGPDDGPAAPHPLRTLWATPTVLDPTRSGDSGSVEVILLLFDGLVELTADLGVRPCVARTWEIQEGGRRYVFHLRQDYRWSDGAPVTAHDFEFSWKRTLDPTFGHVNASIFYGVCGARAYHTGQTPDAAAVGIRARDDWTLVVDLDEPAGFFLHLLAAAPALPVPRHAVQAHGDAWVSPAHLLTNGAFRLQGWEPEAGLTLARNPDYPGRFSGNLQQVQLRPYSAPAEHLDAYARDELDAVGISPSLSEHAQSRFPGESLLFTTLNTHYMGFNTLQPPLDDPRVRRALVMALDREELAGAIFKGRYALATGGFVPPGLPGHSPGIALPFDPAAARRLLAEAGYPNGAGFPELELRGVGDPDNQRGLAFYQEKWRAILGINTRIAVWNKVDGVADSPGIWSLGWVADYPDADSFLRVAIESENSILVHDPEYHRLVAAARRSGDQAERVRLYQAADRILIEDAYLAPLTYGRNHLLVKPWVKNYRPLPLRTLSLKEVILEDHP